MYPAVSELHSSWSYKPAHGPRRPSTTVPLGTITFVHRDGLTGLVVDLDEGYFRFSRRNVSVLADYGDHNTTKRLGPKE